MPNWCDCKLTIKGPNRQAVLDKIKGDKPCLQHGAEQTVYFDLDRIIPMPEGENCGDWAYDNWGCRTVYPDDQFHDVLDDADIIRFYTPWNPPLWAIARLSAMFPENSFVLEDHGEDLPTGATMFRCGKYSTYHYADNINGYTGKMATLFEIFCAVLNRTGIVEEAKKEVERVKALRLDRATAQVPVATDSNYDPTLDPEAAALIEPLSYDISMISTDERQIAELLADTDRLREHGTLQVPSNIPSQEVMNSRRGTE